MMKPDKYTTSIDRLLRQIAELERCLSDCNNPQDEARIRRHLRTCHERFEQLIPFQFKLELHRICRAVGIRHDFI
ncbi:MAG: hypothetical protein SF053_13255 [Bacteroidia bacterium]|nr:hypothetical protein [Bacteroidia bacterium]